MLCIDKDMHEANRASDPVINGEFARRIFPFSVVQWKNARSREIYVLAVLVLLSVATRALYLMRGNILDTESMAGMLALRQGIADAYTLAPNMLAGYTSHNIIFSEQGLVYFGLKIEQFLGFLGFYHALWIADAAFITLAALCVFLYTKEMTGDHGAALFAVLFFALSGAGMYSSAFNLFRGDVYVPALSLLSLLMMIKAERPRTMLLSVLPAVLAFLIWNGGVYAIVLWVFAFIAAIFSGLKREGIVVLSSMFLLGWGLFFLAPVIITSLPFLLVFGKGQVIINGMQVLGMIEPFAYQTYPIGIWTNALGSVTLVIWILVGFATSWLPAMAASIKVKWDSFGSADRNRREAWMVVWAMLLFAVPFTLQSSRFESLLFIPISILAGSLLSFYKGERRRFVMLLFSALLIFGFVLDTGQIVYSPAVPSISKVMKQAMLCTELNTVSNATFLSSEADGTAIQYWGDRKTFSDTNYNANNTEWWAFEDFLYARAGNLSYVVARKPDYLLVSDFQPLANRKVNGTNLQLFERPQRVISGMDANLTLVYEEVGNSSGVNNLLIYSLKKEPVWNCAAYT